MKQQVQRQFLEQLSGLKVLNKQIIIESDSIVSRKERRFLIICTILCKLDNTIVIYVYGDNGTSAEGIILTSGGRFAGFGLYLLEGKPVSLRNLLDLEAIKWEGTEALSPGKHTIAYDFKDKGLGMDTLAFNTLSGLGYFIKGTLSVDGKVFDTKKMEKTIPIVLQLDEFMDICSDTETAV